MAGFDLDYDPEQQRPGHVTTMDKFAHWCETGCSGGVFSLFMACRYGKSDMLRNVALIAQKYQVASGCLVVTPSPYLAKQLLDADRMMKWKRRWLPSAPNLHSVVTLTDFTKDAISNGEWIASIHIQALMVDYQMDCVVEWAKQLHATTGLWPLICLDETHQYSSTNKWGSVPKRLHSLGCPVFVCTATPYRTDQSELFGFSVGSVTETENQTIVYTEPIPDDDKHVIKHTVEREVSEFEISADVEVPFTQAWQEECIAHATHDFVDWDVSGWGKQRGKSGLLSSLSAADAREAIRYAVRDPKVIDEVVHRCLAHLDNFRTDGIKDAAAIFFCMDDQAGEDNAHLRQVKESILRQSSKESVKLASLKADDVSDNKSRQVIEAFCSEKKPSGSILLLKQMGSVGLDADRICVVVLIHTTRALGTLVQQMMRGGNVGGKTHFVVISLNDVIMQDRWQKLIRDQGGEFKSVVEVDHQQEKVVKKPHDNGGFLFNEMAGCNAVDSTGRIATWSEMVAAHKLVREFPALISYTYPRIVETMKKMGMNMDVTEEDLRHFVNSEELIGRYRDDTNAFVDIYAKHVMYEEETGVRWCKSFGSDKEKRDILGKCKAKTVARIKYLSGVNCPWDASSKKRSMRIDDYQKWYTTARSLVEQIGL